MLPPIVKHKGYSAYLTIDLSAGVVSGRVLEINDVLTFEGKTPEEATQEFVKTVETYLELCRQEGLEPEKPFSGRLPFRTEPEVHRLIYLAATKEGKSINAWMGETLKQAAQHTLNRRHEKELPSPSIQYLIEKRDGIAQLVAAVSPFLTEPPDIVQRLDGLEKLLMGIDAIQPHLNPDEPDVLERVVAKVGALLVHLKRSEPDLVNKSVNFMSIDPDSVSQSVKKD